MADENEKKHDGGYSADSRFFSKREIWEQVFGKDGRGGAIGGLYDHVDDQFKELKEAMCAEFKKTKESIEEMKIQLKEHNGVKEKVKGVDKGLDRHLKEWNEYLTNAKTQKAIEDEKRKEREKGREEADRKFMKRMKIASVWIALSGLIAGIVFRIIMMLFN